MKRFSNVLRSPGDFILGRHGIQRIVCRRRASASVAASFSASLAELGVFGVWSFGSGHAIVPADALGTLVDRYHVSQL